MEKMWDQSIDTSKDVTSLIGSSVNAIDLTVPVNRTFFIFHIDHIGRRGLSTGTRIRGAGASSGAIWTIFLSCQRVHVGVHRALGTDRRICCEGVQSCHSD
jgi:hypothetical protein